MFSDSTGIRYGFYLFDKNVNGETAIQFAVKLYAVTFGTDISQMQFQSLQRRTFYDRKHTEIL
jgi:hypothetical protein